MTAHNLISANPLLIVSPLRDESSSFLFDLSRQIFADKLVALAPPQSENQPNPSKGLNDHLGDQLSLSMLHTIYGLFLNASIFQVSRQSEADSGCTMSK